MLRGWFGIVCANFSNFSKFRDKLFLLFVFILKKKFEQISDVIHTMRVKDINEEF